MTTLAPVNVLLHNKRLKRALDRVSARHDRPLPAATPREEALVAELRRRIETLDVSSAGADQPSERIWRRFIEQFRDAMGRDDPRAFLRWPTIAKAMFVSNQPYLSIELLSLRSRRDWRQRWRPALRESPVGHPRALLGAAVEQRQPDPPRLPSGAVRGADRAGWPSGFPPSSSSAAATAACADSSTSWGSRAAT